MTFTQAAEAHLDDVYGYLAWFTGDRDAADDLAGETFERALRLWHRFDPDRGSVRTWLCQVARTVALDHFRSERRRTRREQLAAQHDRVEERFVEGLSPDLENALRAPPASAKSWRSASCSTSTQAPPPACSVFRPRTAQRA
jgi:RNA polymerase sigma-70 factor (ECF subfamily)